MGKRVVDDTSLSGVADAIRAKSGIPEEIIFPEGFKTGVDDVFAAGKKREYDRFWDNYQQNGGTNYSPPQGVFLGSRFNFNNFYPKYDIRPVGSASCLFYAWESKNGEHYGDFKGRLDECGVVLDTSGATNITSMFNYSHMDNIPAIDCTGLTVASSSVFANSWGDTTTIEKIIVKEDVTFTNWFVNATGLINVMFEGVIGQNGLNMQWSKKLSRASITSVVNALSDTTSDRAVTFSKTAVDAAFETAEGEADGSTSAEWTALANTKSNWTINLV